MTKEDRDFIQNWEKAKKTGFWFFCLKIGGTWAVVLFFSIQFFTCLDSNAQPFKISTDLLLSFLNYLLAGYFGVGALIWFFSERRYKKIVKNQS